MSTTIKISLKNQTVTPVKSEVKNEDSFVGKHSDIPYNGETSFKNETSVFDTSEYIEDESGFEGFDVDQHEDESGFEGMDTDPHENESGFEGLDINTQENKSGFEGLDVDPHGDYDFDNIEPTIAYSDQIGDLMDLDKNEDSNGTGTDSDYNTLIHREDPNNIKGEFYDSNLNSEENTEDVPPRNEQEATGEIPTITSCSIDPNFAIVVDFMEKFGEHIGLKSIPMKELEAMLCDTNETIHPDLVQLHCLLLKKIKLSKKLIITKKSWMKGLILFCNGAGGMIYEGLELQNLGYSQISVTNKLELLKVLMESQFDWNELVRALVDDLPVEAMRNEPTGKDIDGHRFWTQIDDLADIRIYSESSDNLVWESIVVNRADLVDLVERLKQNKLYKAEIEKIKASEAQKEEEDAIVNSISEMEKDQKEKLEEFNTDYKCEVCMLDMGTKLDLMEHYSGGHMAFGLKEKFEHLVDKGQCKICKFEADEEHDIYIHIGTLHEKVNSVLKEKGLKPVGDKVKEVKEEDTTQEIKPKPEESMTDIEKLEKKIKEVQDQMCAGESKELTEISSDDKNCDSNACDNNVDIGESNQSVENEEKSLDSVKAEDETNSIDSCDTKSDYTEAPEQIPNNEIDKNVKGDDDDDENRPRRRRACKDKVKILKAAISPPKKRKESKEKEQDDEKKERSNSDAEEENHKGKSKKRKKGTTTKHKQRTKKKKIVHDEDEDYEGDMNLNERKNNKEKKVIDVTKEMKVKERVEIKLSCKKCNQWQTETDTIFECKTCKHSWHQFCVKPPLYYKPKKDWLCPLCNHIALVQNMEQTILELDILMEKAEERRLAAIIENQNQALMETDEDTCSTPSQEPTSAFAMPSREPSSEADDFRLPPDYYEGSSENDMDSDEDWEITPKAGECTCESTGNCLFCKKKKGCTCEGMGTCRLCAMEKENNEKTKLGESLEGPQSPPKMSTTEMFLLTGQERKVEVAAHEDDGFVYRGKLRGRGSRGGAIKKPKGPKGSKDGAGRGRGLPQGISIMSTAQLNNVIPNKAGRGSMIRGRVRIRGAGPPRGINGVTHGQQRCMISQRPQMVGGSQMVKVTEEIDVIDIDLSDDEAEPYPNNTFQQEMYPQVSFNSQPRPQNQMHLQRGPRMAHRARTPIQPGMRQPAPQILQRMPRHRGRGGRGPGQRMVNVTGGVIQPAAMNYGEEDEDDPSYMAESEPGIYEPQASIMPIQPRKPRQIRGGRGISQQNSHMRGVPTQQILRGVANSRNYGQRGRGTGQRIINVSGGVLQPASLGTLNATDYNEEDVDDPSHMYDSQQGIYEQQSLVVPIQQRTPRQRTRGGRGRGERGRILRGPGKQNTHPRGGFVPLVVMNGMSYVDEEEPPYMYDSEQAPYEQQEAYDPRGRYDPQGMHDQNGTYDQHEVIKPIKQRKPRQRGRGGRGPIHQNIQPAFHESMNGFDFEEEDSFMAPTNVTPRLQNHMPIQQGSMMTPKPRMPMQQVMRQRTPQGVMMPSQQRVPQQRGRAGRGVQPQHVSIPSQRGGFPHQRGQVLPQRGVVSNQRGGRPVQRGFQPVQRGVQPGQRVIQSGQRGLQRGGVQPVQRGLQPGHRGIPNVQRGLQRGAYPIQRGAIPAQRGSLQAQRGALSVQRGAIPSQRGPLPVQRMRGSIQRGTNNVQRGVPVLRGAASFTQGRGGRGSNLSQQAAHPQNTALQRGVMPGRGRPAQRQMMSNPRRMMQPVMARGSQRMPQPRPLLNQGGAMRGRQPAKTRRPRARGRAASVRGNPRMTVIQNGYTQNNYQDNSFENDDIIIPTVNHDYDYDMIADDELGEEEIPSYEGADDDNIMSDSFNNQYTNDYDQNNYSEEASFEEDANLSRLPQHIQIERVSEHNAWN